MRRGKIEFRVIHANDEAFLRRLYASTRAWEFQLTDWTDEAREDFLRRQFDAQDTGYKTAYPGAVHRIIALDDIDIGRLIVDRQDECLRIVDLSLMPDWCGRGIGTDILRSLMNEAHGGKVPVRLHVMRGNPAERLYLRHGFRPTGIEGHHVAMEWRPEPLPRVI